MLANVHGFKLESSKPEQTRGYRWSNMFFDIIYFNTFSLDIFVMDNFF